MMQLILGSLGEAHVNQIPSVIQTRRAAVKNVSLPDHIHSHMVRLDNQRCPEESDTTLWISIFLGFCG